MPDIKQKCIKTGKEFVITEGEQEMLKKFDVPLPTLCPEERWKQRLHFRNYRYLHYRDCSFCKKKTLSVYPAGTEFPVYCTNCFYNGAWEPPQMDFDFNEDFFPQFKQLLLRSPHIAISLAEPLVNSEYNNGGSTLKNCYMNFNSDHNEDCYYCHKVHSGKNIVDSVGVFDSEIVYSSTNIRESYNIFWSDGATKCTECYFIFDCSNAQNCFMSTGVRHKQYVFRGTQLTKEKYFEELEKVDLHSWDSIEKLKKEFEELKMKAPRRAMVGLRYENATGNFIFNSKEVHDSFSIENSENIWYSSDLKQGKDCMDQSFFNVGGGELIYSAMTVGIGAYNIKFAYYCWSDVSNLEYCYMCTNSVHDCFGCVALHKSQYKILNKQYTQIEFEEMKNKIKAHMRETGEYGKYFPTELSHFAYNESIAQFNFPLTKEEAKKQGYEWREREVPQIQEGMIVCEKSGRPFKMVKPEIDFHKKYNIPFPKLHPDERFYPLYANLGPFVLGVRACSKCNKQIKTVYLDSALIVYCEECYNEGVY